VAGTLEVVAHWEGGYRCTLPVRGFQITVDEPPSAGGTDTGPMPTELFLSSLASCFTLSVYHAARKRSIELPDLSVRVSGEYKGLRFEKLTVEVISTHPRAELEALIEPAIRTCYVSQTLKNQPEVEYVVKDDPVTPGSQPPPA
jgi:putative redox protein